MQKALLGFWKFCGGMATVTVHCSKCNISERTNTTL